MPNFSFNITDKELADALQITAIDLYEVCNIFDKNPNDQWELLENEHFIWLNKSLGTRKFSVQGADEICKYVNEREKNNILRRFKRWVSRRNQRIQHILVAKRIVEITEDGNSYIIQNHHAYLRPRYTRELLGLGTRQDILNRAFQSEQKQTQRQVMEINTHFIEQQNEKGKDEICFSGAGVARLGENLGKTLTKQYRQEWCKLIAKEAPKALREIIEEFDEREDKIKKAMDKAKKNARGTCQITGRLRQPGDVFDLAVHHVFDKSTYPHLADHPENLIVITADIHKDFHQSMGGCKVSCTVDDLEKYIMTCSTSLFPNDENRQMQKILKRISRIRQRVKPLT